jgi:hypothetical protein
MKQERNQTVINYEVRVKMLSKGQYEADEIDPFYQEKFEFAVEH